MNTICLCILNKINTLGIPMIAIYTSYCGRHLIKSGPFFYIGHEYVYRLLSFVFDFIVY